MPEIDMRPSVVIPLKFPFELEGTKYDALTMRRPKMRDTIHASGITNDTMRGIRIMSLLTGTSDDVIGELDEVDAEAVQAQYAAFKGSSVKTT